MRVSGIFLFEISLLGNNVEMIETEELKEIITYCPTSGAIADKEGNSLLRTDGKGGYVVYIKGKRYPAHNIAYQYHYGTYPPTRGFISFVDLNRDNISISNLQAKGDKITQEYLTPRFYIDGDTLRRSDNTEVTSKKVYVNGNYYSKATIIAILEGKEHTLRSDNLSGYPGVCWSSSAKKWQATYKCKYLGVFTRIEEAAAAVEKEKNK